MVIVDGAALIRHGYLAGCRQQREACGIDAADSHLSVAVDNGNQIDSVADVTVFGARLCQVSQRLPLVEQRHTQRLTLQSVDDDGVEGIGVIVHIAEDEGVVIGNREDKGTSPRLRHILHMREVLLPVELLYAVAVVPVARDDDPSAVLFYARGEASLAV